MQSEAPVDDLAASTLLERSDSVLIIVDVQEYFLKKLPVDQADALVGRIVWLVKLARWLEIPMVVTAEELDRHGGPISEVENALSPSASTFDKPFFGLAANDEILRELYRTNRRTAVLVGLETDVCVCQSALGLLDQGFRVLAVSDATSSPGLAHEDGLRRMSAANVELITTKMLFYEWTRSVEMAARFRATQADPDGPPGIIL